MLRKVIFQAGMKKMEYKSRQWHEKCFVCCTCKNPIGTKSFIPKVINRESSVSISGVFNFEEYWELMCRLNQEHDIYCAGCYEDKFATKCIKCNKVKMILSDLK